MHTLKIKSYRHGFTIVELLIIIVVIGILATISSVSYNGFQDRARKTALQSDLRQAAAQLELERTLKNEYPANVDTIKKSPDTKFTYTKVNKGYCLSASNESRDVGSFHVVGTSGVDVGPCPMGHWAFNGNTEDRSPYGNDGIASGATLITDRGGAPNSAYNFNGSTSRVECGSSTTLKPVTEVSVSAWIYPTAFNPLNGIVNNGNGGYWLYLGSTGIPGFYIGDGSLDASNGVSTNQWHHIVGTYNSGNRSIYVNGKLVASDGRIGNIINYSSGNNCLIGSVKNIADRFYAGSIDDVRIYNQALTSTEIKQLYDN